MRDRQWRRTQVDIAKGAATDLAADTVFVPHAEVLLSVSVCPRAYCLPAMWSCAWVEERTIVVMFAEASTRRICRACCVEERDAALQPYAGLLVVVRVCVGGW